MAHIKEAEQILASLGLDSLQKMNEVDNYVDNVGAAFLEFSHIFLQFNQVEKSRYYALQALDVYEKSNWSIEGKADYLRQVYMLLKEIYQKQGKTTQALEVYEKAVFYKDTLTAMDKAEETNQLVLEYDLAQQEKENALQQNQLTLLAKESQLQKTLFYSSVGVLILIAFLAFSLYRNNQNKQKANKLLSEQKEEINQINEELYITLEQVQEQSQIIHKKNEDITASITYAKRIQTAMLPRTDDIQKALPESFILFKPRDIVSGDFYYFKEIAAPPPNPSPQERGIDSLPEGEGRGGAKIIIACADCTGHGVLGAFMSMIGNEILTNIVEIQGITSPDLILNELHKNIRAALKQGETENRDGMDISIVMIDKEKQILEYAGAMNPLYYVEYDFPNRAVANSDLESRIPVLKEIKADKSPIGGSQKEQERTFTKHTIELGVRSYELEVGKEQLQTSNHFKPFQTILYLCSDGFQDQFGGAQGKKFMVKKFRELLFSIHHLPMHEQKQILDETIESWMAEGKEHQIDDILVMGVAMKL